MPIKVPNNLPAVETLTRENVFVMTDTRAMTQDIRPLQILILNLMPTKVATETQLTRLLGNSPLQVELELLQTSSHKAQNVSEEHMIAFYKTFRQVRDKYYDGMIITGAPVELLDFEEVDYWEELCEIMEWSKTHVHSTFHICWGAQAALYYHYGIQKRLLPKKLSGVYRHTMAYKTGMLFRGFDDEFYVPHSRNTEVSIEDVEAVPELKIVSVSDEAGIFAIKSENDRQIFIMGHSEYDWDTLQNEYLRDKNAGINPEIPCNYYPDDDDAKAPVVRWRSCANLLYSNWLNYFVYQSTPYDINQLKTEQPAVDLGHMDRVVCKFGGTSLADGDQFQKVREIVKSNSSRAFVVASAPGAIGQGGSKVTDLLLAASQAGDAAALEAALTPVQNRFQEIENQIQTGVDIAAQFQEILRVAGQDPAGHEAYLASRGEYLCSLMLARYLDCDLVDAADCICFDGAGNYLPEETQQAIAAQIADHPRAVIPGFYGADEKGDIHTFSRGGSDLTGAIVAAAVGADLYENWTDVSGLLMADPRVVKNPLPARIITYQELRELAALGAKVLHEDTVFPVISKEIPIQIRNTNDPENPGTLIVRNADYYESGSLISGISGRNGFVSILLEKDRFHEDPSIRMEVMDYFASHHIRTSNVISGIDAMTLFLPAAQLERNGFSFGDLAAAEKKAQAAFAPSHPDVRVTIKKDLAIIGIVGREIANSPEVAVKVLNALSSRRIDIRLVDHGTEKMNMLVGVNESDYDTAMNAIYQALVR